MVLLLFCNLRSWGAVSYYTKHQHDGAFRCQSITILFGDGKEGGPTAPDEFYGGAYVNGKEKLLMFSHFNGVYIEDGEYSCLFASMQTIIFDCSPHSTHTCYYL
jgi:hypothetical protein